MPSLRFGHTLVLSLVSLLGCGTDGPNTAALQSSTAALASDPPANPAPAIHYVRATALPANCETAPCGGYLVTPLDGTSIDCGATVAASCRVDDIQLATADMTRDEGLSWVQRLSSDDRAFSIVFTGRVVPRGEAGPNLLFEAYELWSSTRPVAIDKTLFHVTSKTACAASCTNVDSVEFGSWTKRRSNSFVLRGIQELVPERGETGRNLRNNCGLIKDPPEVHVFAFALQTATGLLAAGTWSEEAFTASDVFVRAMASPACNHDHNRGSAQCCGLTYLCRPLRRLPCPKWDHILGGVDFEYERSAAVSSFLTATNQPLSPTAHSHAPVSP